MLVYDEPWQNAVTGIVLLHILVHKNKGAHGLEDHKAPQRVHVFNWC